MEDMGLWLNVDKLDSEGETSDPPDLFVIGFQEVWMHDNFAMDCERFALIPPPFASTFRVSKY